VLGGVINAVKSTGIPLKAQRAVFLGAGSAGKRNRFPEGGLSLLFPGVGVAQQIVDHFVKQGLTEDQARRCFWLVDSKVSWCVASIEHASLIEVGSCYQ